MSQSDMLAVILRKSDLIPWVRGLLASTRVVAPIGEGDGPVRYRPLASAEAAVLAEAAAGGEVGAGVMARQVRCPQPSLSPARHIH